MKMKDFIQYILRAMRVFKDFPIDENNVYQCRHAEIMKELKELLLAHENLDEPLNEQTLKPFCAFLKKRFEFIHNTRLTYFVDYGPDNEKCFLLAKFIAPYVKVHFLKLLIPTLIMTNKALEFTHITNNRSRMLDFFIAEDGRTLIRRSRTFAYAAEHGQLTYTYGDYGKEISEVEKNLVINFTLESQEYYRKILYDKMNVKSARQFYFQNLNENKIHILPDYGYGEAGDERLTLRVLESSKTFKELAQIIGKKIEKSKWENIIKKKIDIKLLTQLILNTDSAASVDENLNLMMTLKKMNLQMNDESTTRAAGLCALRVYWLGVRKLQGDFTSSIGNLLGTWVAYSKENKKEAVDTGMAFLLSDGPVTEEALDQFLKNNKKEHVKGALLERGSVLGIIFSKILFTSPKILPAKPNVETIDKESTQMQPPSLKLG